jgi:hypothetical protein
MSSERRDVVIRRYTSRSYDEAIDAYEVDLAAMADAGRFPVGQSWGWDAVGSAGWLVSGSHWKPADGTLAVTYRRDPGNPRPDPST